MNETLVAASAITAISIAVVGLIAYKMRPTLAAPEANDSPQKPDDSSLEEDFQDLLEFLPLKEINTIIDNYASHDPQIADTISFINDQKRFIIRELCQIPEVMRFVDFLWQNGLEIDNWAENIRSIWITLPCYKGPNDNLVTGGLSLMTNKIFKLIPRDELHEHLREKIKYSNSFKRFITYLKSEDFTQLCEAVGNSDILSQHIFWAKDSGIEVVFAIELLRHSHNYLTRLVT